MINLWTLWILCDINWWTLRFIFLTAILRFGLGLFSYHSSTHFPALKTLFLLFSSLLSLFLWENGKCLYYFHLKRLKISKVDYRYHVIPYLIVIAYYRLSTSLHSHVPSCPQHVFYNLLYKVGFYLWLGIASGCYVPQVFQSRTILFFFFMTMIYWRNQVSCSCRIPSYKINIIGDVYTSCCNRRHTIFGYPTIANAKIRFLWKWSGQNGLGRWQ